MRHSSTFFTAVLLALVVLLQVVVAKLPGPGKYRLLNAAVNRPVRASGPGRPLTVGSGGIGVNSTAVWQLQPRGGLATFKLASAPLYARSAPRFVTVNSQPTTYRLRPAGVNLWFIENGTTGNANVWTVVRNEVTLQRRTGSNAQKFRLVRVLN
ncbi:hypothetical protein DFQ26_006039 [Actinomortierella ambigua]|nr:hypothetical protein DFQ26_006039 [Actinomortierella ambigua]